MSKCLKKVTWKYTKVWLSCQNELRSFPWTVLTRLTRSVLKCTLMHKVTAYLPNLSFPERSSGPSWLMADPLAALAQPMRQAGCRGRFHCFSPALRETDPCFTTGQGDPSSRQPCRTLVHPENWLWQGTGSYFVVFLSPCLCPQTPWTSLWTGMPTTPSTAGWRTI